MPQPAGCVYNASNKKLLEAIHRLVRILTLLASTTNAIEPAKADLLELQHAQEQVQMYSARATNQWRIYNILFAVVIFMNLWMILFVLLFVLRVRRRACFDSTADEENRSWIASFAENLRYTQTYGRCRLAVTSQLAL